MREITIDGRRIADDEPAYLIAEIGHNHAHDMKKLLAMVDSAKENGADAVKFQTRNPKMVYAPTDAPGGYYFKSDNPQWLNETYGVHREKLELTELEWGWVFEHCRGIGITAFSTPFDSESAEMLAMFDVPAFKIASGDATNTPLLKQVAGYGKPMIVSTGGCDIEDVDRIVETLEGASKVPFALLQCSCIYPAPSDVLNLRVISGFRDRYGDIVTGLSTHSPDWTPTLAAYALGGRIFEHHYTNDRSWKGTDNNFSLTPSLLRELRQACDSVMSALGSPDKRCDLRERSYTDERRKALYWKRDLPAGHVVTEDDLIAMCPYQPGMLHPYEMDKIVGHTIGFAAEKGGSASAVSDMTLKALGWV